MREILKSIHECKTFDCRPQIFKYHYGRLLGNAGYVAAIYTYIYQALYGQFQLKWHANVVQLKDNTAAHL